MKLQKCVDVMSQGNYVIYATIVGIISEVLNFMKLDTSSKSHVCL